MFVDEKKHGEATPDLGTLRVDRILMLADEIEKPTKGWDLDMSILYQHRSCGTSACIAGHALLMFDPKAIFIGDAEPILGLDAARANALFKPKNWDHPKYNNRRRAARVLRHLATTGNVDWNIPLTP